MTPLGHQPDSRQRQALQPLGILKPQTPFQPYEIAAALQARFHLAGIRLQDMGQLGGRGSRVCDDAWLPKDRWHFHIDRQDLSVSIVNGAPAALYRQHFLMLTPRCPRQF